CRSCPQVRLSHAGRSVFSAAARRSDRAERPAGGWAGDGGARAAGPRLLRWRARLVPAALSIESDLICQRTFRALPIARIATSVAKINVWLPRDVRISPRFGRETTEKPWFLWQARFARRL